jgi:hypothetical protein
MLRCVFSRRKVDLRRHVECVQLAAALLFDRQRTLRTESGSKLHALHMKELAKHIHAAPLQPYKIFLFFSGQAVLGRL